MAQFLPRGIQGKYVKKEPDPRKSTKKREQKMRGDGIWKDRLKDHTINGRT